MFDLNENTRLAAGGDRPTAPAAHNTTRPVGPSLSPGSGERQTTPSPEALGDLGSPRSATDTTTTSVPADNAGSSKVGPPLAPLGPPPKPSGVTGELFTSVKGIIASQTCLSDDVCSLITFWIISTWLHEALTVIPCLVITGPAHEAMGVLRVLEALCCRSLLLAGFKRADIKGISGACSTLLISEPNLDKGTATLLGTLTNRGFKMAIAGYYLQFPGAKAIYIGEDPAVAPIQHSVNINVSTPRHAVPPTLLPLTEPVIDCLRNRLNRYRETSLEEARRLEFNPSGLSLEAYAVANALGSCIIGAPELRSELVALLRPHDRQRVADRSDSPEALIVGAVLALCHKGETEVFVKDIAAEVNRVQEARGEAIRYSPEKVGHRLKKVGLLTCRLNQAGNGLVLDRATVYRVHEIAAAYEVEVSMGEAGNLHCPLCS